MFAWAVLSLLGIYWRPFHAPSAAACAFAMGIGCVANWLKNRSFHCALTSPLFLIAGVVFTSTQPWFGGSFSSESASRSYLNGDMRSVPRLNE